MDRESPRKTSLRKDAGKAHNRVALSLALVVVVIASLSIVWAVGRPNILSVSITPNVISVGSTGPTLLITAQDRFNSIHSIKLSTKNNTQVLTSREIRKNGNRDLELTYDPRQLQIGANNLEVKIDSWFPFVQIPKFELRIAVTSLGFNFSLPSDLNVDIEPHDGQMAILTNFPSNELYQDQPPDGGKVILISSPPLPANSLADYIAWNLRFAQNRSEKEVSVGGLPAKEIQYQLSFDPNIKRDFIYFVSGPRLVKFFLIYNQGDPQEADYLRSFHDMLKTVRTNAQN